jgi:D-3-phosphoglycerate dehydrogenase
MTLTGTVLITDCDHPTIDVERAIFAEAGLSVVLRDCRTPDQVITAGTETQAIGLLVQYATISGDVLRSLPWCRAIGRYGVGLDTIDLATAAELGVPVLNVPEYCTNEVADHALGLILALTRGIVALDRGVQRGVWDFRLGGLLRRPSSQRVGVVGLGRIGIALARRARALGYDVVAADPRGPRDGGVRMVDLEELLRTSDIVSLHAPLDDTTHHLIDARTLSLMRPNAILVNTSRGGLVDHDALVDALRTGRIAGAALDVQEREPLSADDPLIGLPNVVLTPHAAFYSEESLVEMKRTVTERLVAALIGTSR